MILGAWPEKLIEQRAAERGGKEFLVKWKGYQSFDNSWTHENELPLGFLKKYIQKNGNIKKSG